MGRIRWIVLLAGLALLGLVVAKTDLAGAGRLVLAVGWGFALVFALYLLAFVMDALQWQISHPSVPLNGRWLCRFWAVRMVGEAFNNTLPAAGMGGEPVKAMLLKRHYGIDYRASAASLILAKTINVMTLVVFLSGGFALMLNHPALAASYKAVAGSGLAVLATMILGLFLVQHYGVSSTVAAWLGAWHGGRRLAAALEHIRDVEDQFANFYRRSHGRLASALLLALGNWLLGVAEVYFVMGFLGYPVTLAEAWIIEAVAQLVRAGTFFIPASVGAQDGAFVLLCAAITGSPTVGLAAALVRRVRELFWIGWGFAMELMLRGDREAKAAER